MTPQTLETPSADTEPEQLRAMRITPNDIAIFEAIQRHGLLHTPYIHAFVAGNLNALQHRLQKLTDEGYVERRLKYNRSPIDHKIYHLTDKGKRTLGSRLFMYATSPSGGPAHAMMTAIITANIELGAKASGLRFITQDEILQDAPREIREARFPLSLPSDITWTFRGREKHSDRPTILDALFGIDYGNGERYFGVEADCGSEIIEPDETEATSKDFQVNSILRKQLSYDYILRHDDYVKHFNIPRGAFFPLFVTTSPNRARHFAEQQAEISNTSSHILYSSVSHFQEYCITPPIFPNLWNDGWLRAGGTYFFLSNPDHQ